jgi:hypothetical protein
MWMAQGHREDLWSHTSSVIAMIYNRHRAGKEKLLPPSHFNPYAKAAKSKTPDLKMSVRDVRGMLFAMPSQPIPPGPAVPPEQIAVAAAQVAATPTH